MFLFYFPEILENICDKNVDFLHIKNYPTNCQQSNAGKITANKKRKIQFNQKTMKKYIRIIIFAFLSLSLFSCSLIGINFSHKTPKRAGTYPKFTEKDSLRGSIGIYRKNYDVTFYDLNIDIDPVKKYIKGYVDIYFTALSDVDKIQIDLYDNMKINNISFESGELKFTRKYNAVFVSFDKKIVQGNKAKIRVYYEGEPIIAKKPPWKAGFVWEKDENKNPWIGVCCELDGASLWWPVKDVLYDEPERPVITNDIIGLGGRDVKVEDFIKIFKKAAKAKPERAYEIYGVRG